MALPADLTPVIDAIQREATERPIDPRAARAISVLHQRGHRFLLAATTDRGHWQQRATLARAGLLTCFHDVLVPNDLGAAKPDSRFYQAMLRTAGCRAGQVLAVGDHLVNDVLGPLAHGMRAVLVNRHGTADEAPEDVPVIGHLAALSALLATRSLR